MKPKTFRLFFLCVGLMLFLFHSLAAGGTRTVKHPSVLGDRSLNLYLFEVTCTPGATILRMNAYGVGGDRVSLAGESFLKGRTTGKEYRMLRAEGVEPGHWTALPESGTIPFTLYFEPLDKADECFDFYEKASADGWRLEAVSLKPAAQAGKIHCRIEGTMEGHPECSLLLLGRCDQDFRIVPPVLIPVENGHFAYDLYTDGEDPYELVSAQEYLAGVWYVIPFLAVQDTVRFHFAPGSLFDGVQIRGGEHNRVLSALYFGDREQKVRLEGEIDSLESHGLYYTPELMALKKQWDDAETDSARRALLPRITALREAGRELAPAGEAAERRYAAYIGREDSIRKAYMQSHISLPGYFFLHREVKGELDRNGTLSAPLQDLAGRYAEKYPGHWFTKAVETTLASACMERPGGKVLDFVAQDLEGVSHRFSELHRGRIVFLDLWASWCAPCRRHSKEMIPVYEAYKDRGFSVVAVARERGNTEAMQAAMQQDGYPWPSLVDLNDGNRVWARLGVGNSGGKTWLIDRDGTVLLVNPTADEVRRVLEEKLK